ncbi:MAG: YdcF family protein [Cyanobacteria bacterium]|nr:YdcF family protein [Cyanobacteriota bacterium]
MFFIKKILEAVIFPPGIIIIIFLLISFLGRKIRSVLGISLFSAFFVYFISIQPISGHLLKPLESAYPIPSPARLKHSDGIVILSAGAYNRQTLTGDSDNRMLKGLELYRKYHIPVIISGGKATSTFSDAKIIRNTLIKTGVLKNDIIIENKSNDTYENALFTLNICKTHNFKKIILVTSAYHMYRAVFLFKLVRINGGFEKEKIVPYPTDFKTNKNYNIYSFFPDLGSLSLSNEAIHEYLGYLYYLLKR